MRTFLLALVALIVVGCKGESTSLTQSAKATPPGWTDYDRPEYGFSIAAPDNWTLRNPGMGIDIGSIDLNSMGNGEAPKIEEPKNEVIPADLERQQKKGLGLVLYSKNVKPLPGEELCRIEVKKEDVGAITFKDAMAKGKESIASDATVKEIQLAIGPCAEIRHNDKSIGGDEITRIMYCLADGKYYWTIYLESYNNASEVETVAPELIKTFRTTAQSN
ncbi:MAG: hypothetical protein ABL949_15940 [Fimbriimonadaceae bacterium]